MNPDFTLDYRLGMEALLLMKCHFCLRFLRSLRMARVSSACSADSCKLISLRSTVGIVALLFLLMSRGKSRKKHRRWRKGTSASLWKAGAQGAGLLHLSVTVQRGSSHRHLRSEKTNVVEERF